MRQKPHRLTGLNRCWSLCLFLFLELLVPGATAGGWDAFSASLARSRTELRQAEEELAALGEPQIGNTVPEFGIQHIMLAEPPPESPFVQVDFGASRRFDTVALIPAVVDFQGLTQTPYAFPARFRLDASDDPAFGTFLPLLVHTDDDFGWRGVSPVVIHCPGSQARYLRLTVTKLALVEGRWTFALAELVALDGNRNIALGAEVTHKGGTGLPPRWMAEHLTDGRTPLGPPIDRSSVPEFDALFASIQPTVAEPWMVVDLGKVWRLDEIRIHPLHARQGADVPGFAFPSRFRVEIAETEDFGEAVILHEDRETEFPNPGNNAVVISADHREARYVRCTMLDSTSGRRDAFAISELEVYAGGVKISQGAKVRSSGDPRREVPRPLSLLTDGHTSYGRLLEWPEWLAQGELRAGLLTRIDGLRRSVQDETARAQKRAGVILSGLVMVICSIPALLFWRSHRRQRREQERFRSRLARDMHDEIGSNLAGIAVLSETAALQADVTAEDWREISRIARETTDAMREVLWLVGARQESGIDLATHLRKAAQRLLPGHEVRWLAEAEFPVEWPMDSRREIFLFFKEALANIARHAKATVVECSTRIAGDQFELRIQDNGCGFEPGRTAQGMGLESLRERAGLLGGKVTIDSSAAGTTIVLLVPLSANP